MVVEGVELQAVRGLKGSSAVLTALCGALLAAPQ